VTRPDQQRQKAGAFLEFHRAPSLLVLPNAWDVVSAKIFELEGFTAIGTTSAGVAATLGYADGEQMSLAESLEATRRIADNTVLPVSADLEAGYSDRVEGVVEAAAGVLDAGAVGLNLEDGTGRSRAPLFEGALQQEKIGAIREMSATRGIHLVINARTDVYLVGDDASRNLRDAIERGNAYREAGADCIFVPDVGDLDRESSARGR
jgi:2-methylisocitrate lyase-like PEP mutase family enzyme